MAIGPFGLRVHLGECELVLDLTNRDVAFLAWSTLALLWVIRKVGTRQVLDVLSAVRPFALPVTVYSAWYVLVVVAAWRIGLWDAALLKDTIVWFLAPGLLLFFRFPRTYHEARFIRTTLLGFLGITAIAEFFLNLVSFSLLIELFLLPLVTLLALAAAAVDLDEKTRRLKTPLQTLLGVIVLAWMLATAVALGGRTGGPEAVALARDYAVPIWSTGACLPFVYLFGLGANYQTQFLRLDAPNREDRARARRAKWTLVSWFGLRSRALASFRGAAIGDLAVAESVRHGRRIIAMQQAEVRLEDAEQRLKAARLKRYAGDPGIDWDGQPLDQREFDVTWRVLDELALYQAARHRSAGRYEAGLLGEVGHLLAHTFGSEPELELRVDKGGMAWQAWRRTIGGWYLGRADVGFPARSKRWTGREEPTPGRGEGWVDFADDEE